MRLNRYIYIMYIPVRTFEATIKNIYGSEYFPPKKLMIQLKENIPWSLICIFWVDRTGAGSRASGLRLTLSYDGFTAGRVI